MIPSTGYDKVLIRGFLAGDRTSGNELALRYYRRVLSVCYQYLQTADAHDAAQDVFLKVLGHRKVSTFHGESRLWTWLYRVTVNTCYRHLSVRLARAVRNLPLAEQPWFDGHLAAPDLDPEELTALREQLEQMVRTIYRLKQSYRDSLVLVCLRGYTYAEAGQELGISARALAVRLTRAKKKLAELMRRCTKKKAEMRGVLTPVWAI